MYTKISSFMEKAARDVRPLYFKLHGGTVGEKKVCTRTLTETIEPTFKKNPFLPHGLHYF